MHLMGQIEREEDGQQIVLNAWHTVGRSRQCDLQLADREISKQHALIMWDGAQWTLRDLHSKNGTWFNNSAVQPGRDVPLQMGSTIAFGSLQDRWRVISLSEPVARAVNTVTGQSALAANGLLVLPDPENPNHTIFRHGPGWFVEDFEGRRAPACDQQVLMINGISWVLSIPQPAANTWLDHQPPTPSNIILRFFGQGPDRETLSVCFVHEGRPVYLKQRVHLRVLYILAQARLRDQGNPSIPAKEQGWLYRDELCRRLGIYDNRLYVHVFRAREQLAEAGLSEATNIIERRSDTQQVRIGVSNIEFG